MNYLILPEKKIDELYDEHGEAVLDACYRHYDTELRRENLTQPEIRAFFEAELQARPTSKVAQRREFQPDGFIVFHIGV